MFTTSFNSDLVFCSQTRSIVHVGNFNCSQIPCGRICFLQSIVQKKYVHHNVFIDQLRTKTLLRKHSLPLSIYSCCPEH